MASNNESAVGEVIAQLVDTWNRHDMRAFASLFAEEADFVDVFGNWFKSRVEIEAALSARHATVFKVSRFAKKSLVVRFPRPDIAVVHAVLELTGAVDRQGQTLPPGLGVTTYLMDRADANWRIIAFQNTQVVAPPEATAE